MPKPPGTRQRTNHATSRATLPSVEDAAHNKVPPLYKRPETENWHKRVSEWWNAIWRSPMASEWLDADVLGLVYRTAELQQDFWTADDAQGRVAVETRIAKNEERLGLSPIDRRRLQWEVEKGEQANERTAKRRQVRQASSKDPRDALRVVK